MAFGDLLCVSKSHLYDLRLWGLRSLSDVPKVAESAECATPGKQPTTPGTVTARRWLCKNTDHTPDLCPDSVWKTLTPHPRAGCVSSVSTCNIYSSTSLCGGAELLQKWEMGWCSRTKAAAASCKHLFSAQTRLHSSLH